MAQSAATLKPSSILTLLDHMPTLESCCFHWTTTATVPFRTLFQSIHRVLLEGILVARPEELILERQYDNTRTMTAHFQCEATTLAESGSYYCPQEILLPLSLEELTRGIDLIRQKDVVGLCVTLNSFRSSSPTLQMYVMHPRKGYCYQYQFTLLQQEYMSMDPVQLAPDVIFESSVCLPAALFKQYLIRCSRYSGAVRFEWTINRNGLSVFEICATDVMRETTALRIRHLMDEKNRLGNANKLLNRRKYSVSKLLMFVKSVPSTSTITLRLADRLPLLVDLTFPTVGRAEFLLADVE